VQSSKNRISIILCLCICAGIFIFGLWPLDLFSANNVRWLPEKDGLLFYGSETGFGHGYGGVVFTPKPLVYPAKLSPQKGELSVEIWLKPDYEPTGCFHHVAAFYDKTNSKRLVIGQWQGWADIRVITGNPTREKPFEEIGVPDALFAGIPRFLTITSGRPGITIFLDGKLIKRFPQRKLIGDNETLEDHSLYLGNPLDVSCPWFGSIMGLSIYSRALSEQEVQESYRHWTDVNLDGSVPFRGAVAFYRFDERAGMNVNNRVGASNTLLILARLEFHKPLLKPPTLSDADWYDIIINFLGFVPFGFFLSLSLIKPTKRPVWQYYGAVMLTGFIISMVIEMIQVKLPARSSSQLDLICNTIGTAFGIFCAHWSHKAEWVRFLK